VHVSRRRFLGGAAATLMASRLLGSCTADQVAPVHAPEPPRVLPPLTSIRGADLSFTPELEAIGLTFRDGMREDTVEQLLAARGANLVRLRLWVDPEPGHSDLESTLALARRANAAGCHVLLNLHYSDFWADPTHQPTPGAWADQDLGALAATVHDYTRDVLRAFAAQGTVPALVQVGNEISRGLLWPTGEVTGRSGPDEWDRVARLVQAGLHGVRDAGTTARTVLHTDAGGNQADSHRLFSELTQRGIRFDVAAVSYFPWWHGTIADVRENLEMLARRFDCQVMIAETSYPWTLERPGAAELHVERLEDLPEADRFPPTPDGQLAFLRTVRETVASLGPAGLGFAVWEPAWLPEIAAGGGQENRFANLTMFDWDGTALPSVEVFGNR